MARFGVGDADKYGGTGGSGYFSLKDDKDVARVRFLFDSIEDVEGFAVHEVEVDGKKRYVNCLRNYGDPVDACPFCAAQRFVQVKYFIPLYNIDADRIQTWERGKKFGQKISSLCSRYPHLVSHTFEIERNGRAGEQTTTYEIYETGQDNTTLEQFDVPDILGTHVLDKTADEMQAYLNTGYFPEVGETQPQRRGATSAPQEDRGYTRRTPAGGGRGERF